MDIIVDIDGTLTKLLQSRQDNPFEEYTKEWWHFWLKDLDKCIPFKEMIQFSNHLFKENFILICTARPARYRKETEKWLDDNGIQYNDLFMSHDDFQNDCVKKKDLFFQMREAGYRPTVVIDDKENVVQMWKELGLLTLQVHQEIIS